jgi:hypothetical protein
MRYEIIFIGGIPHVVPSEDESEGRPWNEIRDEMVEFYEGYVTYWRNKDEPRYFDYTSK